MDKYCVRNQYPGVKLICTGVFNLMYSQGFQVWADCTLQRASAPFSAFSHLQRFSWFTLSTLLRHVDLNYHLEGLVRCHVSSNENILLCPACVLLYTFVLICLFSFNVWIDWLSRTRDKNKRNPDVGICWLACPAPISSSCYWVLLSSGNIICPFCWIHIWEDFD